MCKPLERIVRFQTTGHFPACFAHILDLETVEAEVEAVDDEKDEG